MKARPVGISALLVLFAAFAAKADGIPGDGVMKVGRGSDPSPSSMSCNKTDFKVNLNGHGGGIANCINTTGFDWIGLDIFAVIPVPAAGVSLNQDIPCTSVFASCTRSFVKFLGNSGKEEVEIEMSGGYVITAGSLTDNCSPTPPILAPTSCFFINLNDIDPKTGTSSTDPNAHGGWFGMSMSGMGTLNGLIEVRAITPTPEPGTLLLLVGGAGALCFRRRQNSLV